MTVFGFHAVLEAVRAGRALEVRIATRRDARVRQLVDAAAAAGVHVRDIAAAALDRDAGGMRHQGVAARVAAAPTWTLQALVQASPQPPLLVVLDAVEDPQNVGAIVRSVDAAGGSGVVQQTRRAAALEGAAVRASAGAVHHVRVATVVNIARALEELKELGVWVVGLDAGAEIPYYRWDLTTAVALVVGAEGHGLRRLVRERCDGLAAIPMRGQVGSLNVSAATAVMLFEAVRQRNERERGA